MNREIITKLVDSIQKWAHERYPETRKDISFGTGNGILGIETRWMCIAQIRTDEQFQQFTDMAKREIDEIISSPNLDGYQVFDVLVKNILHSTENPDGDLVFFRVLAAKKEALRKVA